MTDFCKACGARLDNLLQVYCTRCYLREFVPKGPLDKVGHTNPQPKRRSTQAASGGPGKTEGEDMAAVRLTFEKQVRGIEL